MMKMRMTRMTRMQDKDAGQVPGTRRREDEDDKDNKDAGQGWGTRTWTMRDNGQR